MGEHMIMGPFWGNVAIVVVTGAITIACFVAMFWMLLRPGERDPQHVKYDILRPDR
ncbi:MAG: hypothetical protein OJF60_001829 [Burkholderiaceae bacterium]|jgi:uncharacterized membrane protein|nr:MAG: hypothetical protein OJF60_001829 [Burkholderiaceae bacterium]